MMDLKPKKTNLGKYEGDNGGFFDLAKLNLLNNPTAFLQKLIDYDRENIQESTIKKAT